MTSIRPVSVSDFRLLPLFSGLDRDALELLAQKAASIDLPAGELLFRKGETGHRFFLLKSGLMRLYLLNEGGQEHTIEILERERLFAEAVMFMGGAYPVYADALEDSRLIAFDSVSFRNLLLTRPTAAMAMLASMSRQLHTLINDIDRISLQQGERRLAIFLLGLPSRQERRGRVATLPASKQAVANLLDIRPETFSRLLARFSQQQLISVDGMDIILHQPEQLEQIG